MRCNSRNIRAMLAPLAVLVPVLLAAPASAKDWTVTKVSGEAWVRTSQAPQVRITEGMSIPASASIGTSAGGRVMLERDQGRIFVSPGTTLVVYDTAANTTQVLQKSGTIELEVEKRSAPYFTVETPVLAALVKGTHFTTTVKNGQSKVSVDHGVVQVTQLSSGKTVDLRQGQSASTIPGARGGLSVSGPGHLPGVVAGVAHVSRAAQAFARSQSKTSAPAAQGVAGGHNNQGANAAAGAGNAGGKAGGGGNSGNSANSGRSGGDGNNGNGGKPGGDGNGGTGGSVNGGTGGNGGNGGNGNGGHGGNK